jgi:receptor-type tyrosine-protein phosphatase gamma
MNSLVEEVVVEAGKTVTLGCPGVTEDSLVLMLEWRANGMRLLEYKSSSTTVVRHFRDRMSLSLKNYSLHLHPVTAADSGTYECVVNNRNALDAVIKLVVRGESVSLFLSESR